MRSCVASVPPSLSARNVACFLFLLTLLVAGCRHDTAPPPKERAVPAVRVVQPERRTIDVAIEQPGFVNAFNQTALFAKESGFIDDYYVDIGDQVREGQLLAKIFVPELKERHDQMAEQVKLDTQLVDVARKSVLNAEAEVAEAKANVERCEADRLRWLKEVERLTEMVSEKVVDKEFLTETQRTLGVSVAAKNAAEAAVNARDADLAMAKSNLVKTGIQVKVAEAEERTAKALLDYTRITAPYDGVVTARNANKGDYVQSATGDKSNANPSAIFVVERTDILRVFCDVDEGHAPYVQPGTKAAVRPKALSGIEIPAAVTRTSWSVRSATRSLWTEIDLTKKEYDGLRPGMYANVSVFIHRPDVFALPRQTVKEEGDSKYCYLARDGKAVKTPVDTALSDGKWVEVARMKIGGAWVKVTGNEQVIAGDTSELSNGDAVQTASQ
jgi:HlyD family secretion protein